MGYNDNITFVSFLSSFFDCSRHSYYSQSRITTPRALSNRTAHVYFHYTHLNVFKIVMYSDDVVGGRYKIGC